MSHDEFTKLFTYMQKAFAEINARFDQNSREHDAIMGIIDSHEKRFETLEQERLFANHQLDAHEAWITRAAPMVKVSYRRS